MFRAIIIDHNYFIFSGYINSFNRFCPVPGNVWTVTAFPAIFTFPQIEIIPDIAPFRCIASEIFEEETCIRMDRISSSADFFSAVFIEGLSISVRIFLVEPVTSAERVIHPPTIIISAPNRTCIPGTCRIDPTCYCERDMNLIYHRLKKFN